MDSKVTIVPDDTGGTIHQSQNNPKYGYVKLMQIRNVIDEDSGFLRRQEISTLLHGEIDHLQLMSYKAGQELQGNIIIKESMEPFNKKFPDYDIKRAGKTGIVCTLDGSPIYRKTVYSTKPDAIDVRIDHDEDCKEKLREAYRAQQETPSAINPNNGNFDLEEGM